MLGFDDALRQGTALLQFLTIQIRSLHWKKKRTYDKIKKPTTIIPKSVSLELIVTSSWSVIAFEWNEGHILIIIHFTDKCAHKNLERQGIGIFKDKILHNCASCLSWEVSVIPVGAGLFCEEWTW